MAVVLRMLLTDVTPSVYGRLLEGLGLDASPPAGQALHLAEETPVGMEVVELWQTSAAAEAYVENVLAPALGRLGERGELRYTLRQLHNLFAPDLEFIGRVGAVSLPAATAGAVPY
jgi:hypothetical protein